MELFYEPVARKVLSAALVLAGLALVFLPTGALSVLGMAASLPTYLWMGLTGVGFAVAGWIVWRVTEGIDIRKVFRESFLIAGFLAALIILVNFSAGYLLAMSFGLFAAGLVGLLALAAVLRS